MVHCALVVTLALASAWPRSLAAQPGEKDQSMRTTITVTIGDKAFAATLADNATATAFKKLLPLSIMMTELNGNEKFASLRGTVPAHASTPSSIQTGDLMLYGSNTLVLFYKSFLNHLQLHEDREDRRPCRTGSRTRFRKRCRDLRSPARETLGQPWTDPQEGGGTTGEELSVGAAHRSFGRNG